MKRAEWVDSTRFFAIFVIMSTHFLAMACPSALSLWEEPPAAYLLSGLTGKLSVAFFCVLLGYFAAKPRPFSFKSFLDYSFKRYFQFAFYILLTTVVFVAASYAVTWLFHTPEGSVYRVICDGPKYNVLYILHDSFLFECTYNDTLWCMRQLFVSSILCYLLGSLLRNARPIVSLLVCALIIAALLLTGSRELTWIANCVLGYTLRIYTVLRERRARRLSGLAAALLFMAAVALIKAPLQEGVTLYFLEGLGSLLLLIVLMELPWCQRLLGRSPFPWLGFISMGLYVTHTPVYSIILSSLYALMKGVVPEALALSACFVVSVALVILCSWLLEKAYRKAGAILFRAPAAAAV